MRLRGTCPKCKKTSVFEAKYLPLIKVPSYADFQPLETFAVCKICDSGGVIKKEMMNKDIVITGEFWKNEEVEKYREKQ